MGLGIYSETNEDSKFSQGDRTNPILEALDGRLGGSIERKLFVRNDDSNLSYKDIKVKPVDHQGVSIVDGTKGFAWKLKAGDAQPTQDQWEATPAANEIELPDLGDESTTDTSTYLPFWLRIEVPRNSRIKTHTDVSLQINAVQIEV